MTANDYADRCLRLLIVDDQPMIRRGLAMILAAEPGLEVVGQAADGLDAVEQACTLTPDVVLMDLQMPRASGVVATRAIMAELPQIRVVVLTTYDDDELVFEAIRAGAHAYLLKDAAESEVVDTIRAVCRGESRLAPSVARKVMEQFRSLSTASPSVTAVSMADRALTGFVADAGVDDPHSAAPRASHERLTDKEMRILDLLADGMSNKQIAAVVFLAEGTVKNYVSRIMDKLHAGSRIELAVRAAARTK